MSDNNQTQAQQPQPFNLISASELKITQEPYLIKGFINLDSNVVVYGESGAGKSFLNLDGSFAVAAKTVNPNIDFFGMEIVESGPVVYFIGEGQSGVAKRIDALKVKYNVVGLDVPFYVVTTNFVFNSQEGFQRVAATCEAIKEKHGKYPVKIDFDTLNKYFSGNENSADDIGNLVRAMDGIREQTGACITVVHHTGKGGEIRGSSALRAGIDTQIGLFLDEEDPMCIVIKNEKMKDQGPMDELKLRKNIMKVGYDERFNEDMTTLILTKDNGSTLPSKDAQKLSEAQKDILKSLESLGSKDVDIDMIITEVNDRRPAAKKASAKSLKASIQKLSERRLVAYSLDKKQISIGSEEGK